MEAPAKGFSGGEEEEESFHDCQDAALLHKETVGDNVACAEDKDDPALCEGDNRLPGQEEKLEDEDVMEFDEEALLELEKGQSEEEREEKRKQSTTLKEEGNQLFKNGEYTAAEAAYTQALQMCPAFYSKDRAILFSNRAAARMKQDMNDFALKDCSKAIELNPDYIRALLRRAELFEKTDKLDEALADYKSVLEKDPSAYPAREACMRLPRQIDERNEKMKAEMISKLKDLGNLVLRPFGLSTENFQVKQDSSSGSYSINFVQNPNNNG
ncbi:tetratricopeptide repeat protein 1 [Xenopus laevis]|uniref:Tetratricopeptide repeat protein 1 n=2 Tax=Xenopus laevis TaxID=8355 RepID=A0A1L8GQZ2_XENLA|nr:tetratricopeptide repeat protein 1 [Xenopus laevis]OCT86274.1 hypothetical protein XELAEV_18019966mg [Xenopus laevis]